jgi:hypothetical protein
MVPCGHLRRKGVSNSQRYVERIQQGLCSLTDPIDLGQKEVFDLSRNWDVFRAPLEGAKERTFPGEANGPELPRDLGETIRHIN